MLMLETELRPGRRANTLNHCANFPAPRVNFLTVECMSFYSVTGKRFLPIGIKCAPYS